jgi:hypothetical protein
MEFGLHLADGEIDVLHGPLRTRGGHVSHRLVDGRPGGPESVQGISHVTLIPAYLADEDASAEDAEKSENDKEPANQF